MNTDHKSINKLFAGFTFVFSLILYTLTLAPTASFWDPGEFIAVSHGLQVTHPPGAPFYLLLGRLFSMFAPAAKVAYMVNMLSAVTSALTVMLLYLIVVRLIREYKGTHPDEFHLMDKIGMYGGALIGALVFAVSDTFWFSAVEAEVYAASMFFTSIVVWMALKWSDNLEDPYNDKWLILIFYMFGLALGVHLLNLLAIFFVAMIIYFKKYEFSISGFLMMAAIASVSFLIIYPITIAKVPTWAGKMNDWTFGLIGPVSFFVLFFIALIYGIYHTQKNNQRIANLSVMCYAMIVIGYSSYALVFIRSQADPPIDENDPETIEAFVSYINRDQYGSTPVFKGNTFSNTENKIDYSREVFFPRRHSSRDRHMQNYAEYNSDWDYFWSYQMNHMYFRYLAWNFIGREADIQDTGWVSGFEESPYKKNPAHNTYFYIPFLLGLIGMVFHFQKDWKRAVSVLALFIMTGAAIIVFLNQTPFEPRERDYAYVGSFFAFAIWIGLGVTALIDLLHDALGEKKALAYAIIGLITVAAPGRMLHQNYDDHDRSLQYVAPDYAYNLLNSCEPYGIIFTNGDNDTFPLWYLQEVEGIRRDVRVVCLSLLNTPWYIKQLKNQYNHHAPPIRFSYSDEQIDRIEDKFKFRKPSDFWKSQTVQIPVDKEHLKRLAAMPDNDGDELLAASKRKDMDFRLISSKMAFPMEIDALDDTVSFYVQGRFLTKGQNNENIYYTMVQDDMIMDIIKQNLWERPIYFAVTVSRDGQMNLQNYFYLEGQAYRVIPKRHNRGQSAIMPEIHGKRLKSFRFTNLNNPNAYFDENIRRMTDNYRELIGSQADELVLRGKRSEAAEWIRWGEETIAYFPETADPSAMVRYAYKYAQVGDLDNAKRLAQEAFDIMPPTIAYNLNRLQRVENDAARLDEQVKEARKNAQLSKARDLQAKLKGAMLRRDETYREFLYAAAPIILVQRIYYMAGDSVAAATLADEAERITDFRFGFSKDADENRKQVEQLFGN